MFARPASVLSNSVNWNHLQTPDRKAKQMKQSFWCMLSVIITSQICAQNIGIGTANPLSSAILDVATNNKGILIPRNTYSGLTAISNPAKGLLVMDTSYNVLMVNWGTPATPLWRTAEQFSSWSLNGNNTNASTLSLGTADNSPLNFKVNGQPAGQISFANSNTYLGVSAGRSNTVAFYNTGIGANALANVVGGGFFGADNNTAIGYNALAANVLYNNTAVGSGALQNNTSGFNNTAVGAGALANNVGGGNNIAIGSGSGVDNFGTYNNTVSIGNAGWLNGASNQVFLGNASTSWIGGYKPWSVYSYARLKSDIRDDVKGLDFILKLRPVSYRQNVDDMARVTGNNPTNEFPGKHDIDNMRMNGFLAQEVEKAAKDADYKFSGVGKVKSVNELYSLSYESFVVPLVKAVQEQEKIIEELQKEVALLKEAIHQK